MSKLQDDPKSLVFCLAEQPLEKDVSFFSQSEELILKKETLY